MKNPAAALLAIQKKLTNFDPKKKPKLYMDTGDYRLNTVLGHPVRGIPYGHLLEVSGGESSGKSATALDLTACAQADGANGVWLDIENSFDAEWAAKRGVDVDRLAVLRPFVGDFQSVVGKQKGKAVTRLINAQEQCYHAQLLVQQLYDANPGKAKFFVVVDSATALQPQEEQEGTIVGQNMRTKSSQAAFFSQLLRGWVGFAGATNATFLFINQIRVNPGQMFGNPEYTPCGRALKFYCHTRAQMRRVGDGRIMQAGKQGGIKGVMKAIKNKSGGREHYEIGYKILFYGDPAMTEYVNADEIKKKEAKHE